MADTKNMKNIFNTLDALLENTDLSKVTAESTGFSELKDGYYLCEVKKAELKASKSSGNPMAAFQLKVIEDGTDFIFDVKNRATPITLKGTKNRIIFKYYVFKDETSVQRFAGEMLRFEDENGESILTKEYFTTSELIEDALDVLIGMRIYVHISTTENADGTSSTWTNLITWKTASALGLKVD